MLLGGSLASNPQTEPFTSALSAHGEFKYLKELGFDVKFEYHSVSSIRNFTTWFSYEDILDWLLDSDAYFILCHPHQGYDWRLSISSLEEGNLPIR